MRTELKYRNESIQRLRHFVDELDRQGFRPLDSLRQMIATSQQEASRYDSRIREIEVELKQQLD